MSAQFFVVITTLLLASCVQHQWPSPPVSPIDLRNEKSIPSGEKIIFGRINVVVNGQPFIWDKSWWDKFHLFILPESGSMAIVYTLADDGSFSWSLPPGNYMITSFKWLRGPHYLIRPVFASFSVPKEIGSAYIGELVINLEQTGASAYPQSSWKLPKAFPVMHVNDDYKQELKEQLVNSLGLKEKVTKKLMHLEKSK